MRHHFISDFLGIVDALALAATWLWVAREKTDYSGWRSKCALAGLMFGWASGVVLLAIFVQISMNINDETGSRIPMQAFIIVLLSLVGLVLALIGKGGPRILALFWCGGLFVILIFLLMLVATAFRSPGF
jgi:hypothetical protein